MNLGWMRPGDWLAGIAGLVLLLSLFLNWYVAPGGAGRSGWEAFSVIDILLALAALFGIAVAVAAGARRTPALPVALAIFAVVAGVLATLLALLRVIDAPADGFALAIGAGVGLVSAVAMTAGAFWALKDERNRGVPMPSVEVRPAPPAGPAAS